MMDDIYLYRQWRQNRDAEAFSELVRRHASMVYAACKRILRNAADAEEVAQECFEYLATAAHGPTRNLGAWLHQLATHRAIDRIKSDARRREREQIVAVERGDIHSPGWNDIYEHVDLAIARLPDRYRELVVEHFLEGKTHEAIGAQLRIPRQTVSYRIAKAVEQIRKTLREQGVVITAAALAAMLTANTTEAAPQSLIATLNKGAMSGIHGAAIPSVLIGGIVRVTMASLLLLACGSIVWIFQFEDHDDLRPTNATAPELVIASTGSGGSAASQAPASEPAISFASADPQRLTGQIVDEEGEPAAGAHVLAANENEFKEQTISGTDGRFTFPPLEQGVYDLFAFKERSGMSVSYVHKSESDAGVLVLNPLGRVTGRVYDRATGEPVVGLTMNLHCFAGEDKQILRMLWAIRRTGSEDEQYVSVSDDEGRYAFYDLLPSKYVFDIARDLGRTDYAFPGYQDPPVDITLDLGEVVRDFDFALARGGSISGRVADIRGNVIPEAHIQLFSSKHSFFGEFEHAVDEGTFLFRGLPTGASYRAYATHSDYAPAESAEIVILSGESAAEIEIVLTKGRKVSGQLIDDSGRPVSGADVAFRGGRGPRTKTDENGAFSFAHVAPGDHRVWVYIDDAQYEPTHFRFTMPEEQDVHDLQFVLNRHAEGTVSGRVTDDDGKPLRGVRVLASGTTPEGSHVEDEVRTDSEGMYRLQGLGAVDRVRVDTYPERYAWGRSYDVPVNSTGVDFVVLPLGHVQGRVLDVATGEPINSFEVRAVRIREERYGEVQYEGEWISVASADGTFRLSNVAPPTVRIEVRAPGFTHGDSGRIDIPPGDTLEGIEIALESGVTLTGMVAAPDSGEPLSGVHIRAFLPLRFHSLLLNEREDVMSYDFSELTITDEDGRFSLSYLSPGTEVGLIAWRSSLETKSIRVVPGEEEILLTLAPEGRLEVALVGPKPADRLTMSIDHQGSQQSLNYSNGGWFESSTGWNPYEWRGLPSGMYRLTVKSAREQVGEFIVEIVPDTKTTLEIDTAELALPQ